MQLRPVFEAQWSVNNGVRYGALAVESGGAGPKAGPLEVK
jgi:hypothetical protein